MFNSKDFENMKKMRDGGEPDELKDPCQCCEKNEAGYESQGGARFCRRCADELGLVCGEKNRIKSPGEKPLHANPFTEGRGGSPKIE